MRSPASEAASRADWARPGPASPPKSTTTRPAAPVETYTSGSAAVAAVPAVSRRAAAWARAASCPGVAAVSATRTGPA